MKRDFSTPYMNGEEAADYLGLRMQTLYNLVSMGKLQPLPGLRRYRFTTAMLDKFLTTPKVKKGKR